MPKRRAATTAAGERLLRAAEAIDASGVTRQMFYNYLAIGLIRPHGRTPGGRNLYGEDTLKRLALIRRLNRSGYTLRDIREIFMKDGR